MKKNGIVYYPRLESEIVQKGVLKRDIEIAIGINHATFCKKINGESCFTLEQALTIWNTWFSDIPIEELFRHN